MWPFEVIVLYCFFPIWEVFSELFNGLSSSFHFAIGLRVFHPGFDVMNSLLFEHLLKCIHFWCWTAVSWKGCELHTMVGHYLFGLSIVFDRLEEYLGCVFCGCIGKYSVSGDEPGCIVFEEDDLFLCLFEPVAMGEAVAVFAFVANPCPSS